MKKRKGVIVKCLNKQDAAVVSAMLMILSGIVLVFCAFFMSEDGEISTSVLWYIGEALLYAGSVFGLKQYVDYKMKRND